MYVFIINPVAGSGRSRKIFSKLLKHKLYQNIVSAYYFTEYRGHAEEIARSITDKHRDDIKAIIVIGGDGTLHEALNGLADGQHQIPIGFIPGGSGNDFARGLSFSRRPINILRTVISDNALNGGVPYWLGTYHVDEAIKRRFVNSIGFGFDAEIAQTANHSRYKWVLNLLRLGKLSYLVALIQVLRRFKPLDVTVEMDGNIRDLSNCWMVTIANHPYYGGGMKVIPNAKIEPARFPVLIIHSISKWKVLGLFMTVFSGKHIRFKEVELRMAHTLKVYSSQKLTYQVDGITDTCYTCNITKSSEPIRVLGTNRSIQSIKKDYFVG